MKLQNVKDKDFFKQSQGEKYIAYKETKFLIAKDRKQ
jgi:hypothetical protein